MKFDAEWIRQAAAEAAEVIRADGLGGDATLAPLDDLPATGEFSEEQAMELLGSWVASAHRHHQFFAPGFIERFSGGSDDDDEGDDGDSGLPPFVLPTAEVRNGIGIVTIPGLKVPDHESDLARQFSSVLDGLIREMDPHVKGWVLDLASHHTGGNMHPMAAGLVGLLGQGRLCGFVSPDGAISWVTATPTEILVDDEMNAVVPNGVPLPKKRVAALVGPGTTSAGEFLVLALRSRADARLFGTRTSGYMTGVELAQLPCGADLGITSTNAVDADGVPCGDYLTPDEVVEDDALVRALEWVSAV